MEAFIKNTKDSSNVSDDNEIAYRVVQGEKELFEILMRRYNQSLYRVIRSYLSHEQDIEDAMQDTYIKAYEKLQQFRGASSFSTWLIRIGINEALMRLRNTAKQQRSLNGLSNETTDVRSIQMQNGHPERKLIQNEIRQILEKAIDNLPEKYRAAYVMKEVEDMEFEAIGICLGITSNNVQVRLHRAKKILKESLYELSSQAEIFTFGNHRCDSLVSAVMNKIK